MVDIFDQKVLCKNCDKQMQKVIVNRKGFELRALKCGSCGETIIHPADVNAMEHFKDLKGKEFRVKMRVVGNSHAISIPKEIVNFINEMHRDIHSDMDDMVRLCFEDFGKLSVHFDELFGRDQRDVRGFREGRNVESDRDARGRKIGLYKDRKVQEDI